MTRNKLNMQAFQMANQRDLLTIDETADLFRVTPRTIRRWFTNQLFPMPTRSGRRLVWSRVVLERLIQQGGVRFE